MARDLLIIRGHALRGGYNEPHLSPEPELSVVESS
jgi:hypothetical protein